MSKPDGNHENPTPLGESFAQDGLLADQEYEQEIRRAVEDLGCSVGSADPAGNHGLVRINIDGINDPDKFYKALHERLRQSHSPAAGNYGRDRHYGIGAVGQVEAAGADVDYMPYPKIIGSGPIWPPKRPRVLQSARAKGQLDRSDDSIGLGVVVGVLDTAIADHEYLVGGFLASPRSLEASRSSGRIGVATAHATFVTGLILQQAPAATVHISQVLSDDGLCDSVALHDAIIDIAKTPIDILNLSLGCNTADDRAPYVLQRAIRKFRQHRPDAIVVAAAGNHPKGKKFWPAALPSVLAVTIADHSNDAWDECRDYPTDGWVDIAAPGSEVISTYLTGTFKRPQDHTEHYQGWAAGTGTSFACAVASGYLARTWRPGCDRAELLRLAQHAPVPSTRSGNRLVLGTGNLIG